MSGKQLEQLTTSQTELQEKLKHVNLSKQSNIPILSQINIWEQQTMEQVQQAAEQVRKEALALLKSKNDAILSELEETSQELQKLRETKGSGEDLIRLEREIARIHKEFSQLAQLSTVKLVTNQHEPIAWNRLIYIEQKPDPLTAQQTPQAKSPGSEEFAVLGTFPEQYCEGRLCAKCGKCRDWYFTGDAETWAWIRNQKNWNEEDVTRWRNGHVIENFQCRPGETCIFEHGFGLPGLPPGPHRDHRLLGFHICLCEDNIKSNASHKD